MIGLIGFETLASGATRAYQALGRLWPQVAGWFTAGVSMASWYAESIKLCLVEGKGIISAPPIWAYNASVVQFIL